MIFVNHPTATAISSGMKPLLACAGLLSLTLIPVSTSHADVKISVSFGSQGGHRPHYSLCPPPHRVTYVHYGHYPPVYCHQTWVVHRPRVVYVHDPVYSYGRYSPSPCPTSRGYSYSVRYPHQRAHGHCR
jgi:hypothetical protein